MERKEGEWEERIGGKKEEAEDEGGRFITVLFFLSRNSSTRNFRFYDPS